MRNIFDYWDKLEKELSNKYIMLFLDYDGTLTPIVETPKKANISLRTKELLKRLSEKQNCKIAIISGRALEDIRNKISIKNIIYSGNHGLQIEGPRIKFEATVSQEYESILEQIKREIEARLSAIKGVLIEDKGLSLSLHYRMADKRQVPFIKRVFRKAVAVYLVKNKIKVKSGKKVLEVRPPVEWDKGKIVLWLLARQKVSSKGKQIMPIYIGDDVTDEDAFKALRNKGLTIFVGNKKLSQVEYHLKNTQEVSNFLRRILEIQKESSGSKNMQSSLIAVIKKQIPQIKARR